MCPVVASSVILSAMAWPTPAMGRRSPPAYASATLKGAFAMASAARWYATVLKTSSPFTSSTSPISWKIAARSSLAGSGKGGTGSLTP